MVMSRGVPHSLPDTPPSLRYGKGYFLSDNEDVMVMDTKLKIIEILQVSAPCWANTFEAVLLMSVFDLFLDAFSPQSVHSECEVGLQDHLLAVHLQERVWRQ